jgi:hypothetical protein
MKGLFVEVKKITDWWVLVSKSEWEGGEEE